MPRVASIRNLGSQSEAKPVDFKGSKYIHCCGATKVSLTGHQNQAIHMCSLVEVTKIGVLDKCKSWFLRVIGELYRGRQTAQRWHPTGLHSHRTPQDSTCVPILKSVPRLKLLDKQIGFFHKNMKSVLVYCLFSAPDGSLPRTVSPIVTDSWDPGTQTPLATSTGKSRFPLGVKAQKLEHQMCIKLLSEWC